MPHCESTHHCKELSIIFPTERQMLMETDIRARLSYISHQIVRSSTPVFTVAIHRLFFSANYPFGMIPPICLMLLAAGFVCASDDQLSITNLAVTLAGVVWTSLKTVSSHSLMREYTTAPTAHLLRLLLKVSTMAALQAMVCAFAFGEWDGLKLGWARLKLEREGLATASPRNVSFLMICANLALAFIVNIWSFNINSKVAPLAINVVGSLRQCVTLALSAVLDAKDFGFPQFAGLVLLLAGLGWSLAFC